MYLHRAHIPSYPEDIFEIAKTRTSLFTHRDYNINVRTSQGKIYEINVTKGEHEWKLSYSNDELYYTMYWKHSFPDIFLRYDEFNDLFSSIQNFQIKTPTGNVLGRMTDTGMVLNNGNRIDRELISAIPNSNHSAMVVVSSSIFIRKNYESQIAIQIIGDKIMKSEYIGNDIEKVFEYHARDKKWILVYETRGNDYYEINDYENDVLVFHEEKKNRDFKRMFIRDGIVHRLEFYRNGESLFSKGDLKFRVSGRNSLSIEGSDFLVRVENGVFIRSNYVNGIRYGVAMKYELPRVLPHDGCDLDELFCECEHNAERIGSYVDGIFIPD